MRNCIFLLLLLAVTTLQAQNSFNCSSHDYYQQQILSNPTFRQNQEMLEKETQMLLSANAKPAAAPPYIIPIVFHVIYTTPAGNISDAQIIDQVNILNKEFNRLQADTVLTPQAFKSFAASFSVEFRLATIDPNGNCTNGINRVYSTLTNCSLNNDDVKAVSYWPSNKYLNIWVTQSMRYSNSISCDGGGYATFPGGPASIDGINIRGDLIGNIGTSATNPLWGNFKGRYLIHELGHWFNLRHIWGDAICGNDQVADTPPAVFSNSNCPTFPRNPNNQCGSNANGEMFCNYMDYSDGNCLNMFTAGQVVRMTAAITSAVSGRNNLWSNSNLIATGTSNPYNYPAACAAMPALSQQPYVLGCVEDSISFVDKSYGGNVSSRNWDFGGFPASSLSDSIVKVKFPAAGVYSFSLTNNYQSTSRTSAFINKAYILSSDPDPNFIVPFSESFEAQADYDKWTVINPENDATAWQLNPSTAYSGFNCISINNFGNRAPLVDEIVSPVYDLNAVENPTLTFLLNFTTRNSNNYDQLQVFISTNCGKTWNSVYLKTGSTLRTMNVQQPLSFTPAPTSGEWRLEKINISPVYAKAKVRFKFTFTSGGGNNLYIDDINMDGINTTGLAKYNSSGSYFVYPNPANRELRLVNGKGDFSGAIIEVADMVGKVCLEKEFTDSKSTSVELNIDKLDPGVYFIRVKKQGLSVYTTRFIKQ